jgi:hypothetical protein
MMARRQSKAGIVRAEIDGVEYNGDRRIGNAERFVFAMRKDRSATITVDANSPEMAEAIALDFWKSRRLGGRPKPTIIRRDALPPSSETAWKLDAVQDEIERAESIADEAKAARDELIQSGDDLRPGEAVGATGLTKGRIYQIRRDRS